MSCTMAGLYRVKLQYYDDDGDKIEDSRLMIMKNTPLCYRWYVVVERGVENADEIVVNVWIWDPLLSSLEERKLLATSPSMFSQRLTEIFEGKGQVPSIFELLPDPRFQLDCSNMTFVRSESIWKFYVRVSGCKAYRVEVRGKPSVASHGCFIRDTKVVISSKCVDNVLQSEGSLTLKGQPGVTMVIKDPCDQETAFLIMSGQCMMTSNGFKSADYINVSTSVIMGGSQNVKDIAITTDTVIYLLEEGSLLSQNRSSGEFMWLREVSDLNAIEGRQACHLSAMRKFENKMFVGWGDGIIHVWHGIDIIQSIPVSKEGVSSLPYPFWIDKELMKVFVGYAAFTHEPNELIIIMQLTSHEQTVSILFKKDWTSDSWGKPLPFFSKKDTNTSVSLIQFHDSEGNSILWDTNHVYYSYAKGDINGEMLIHNALDESEIEPYIKQLTVTMSGGIIILSAENVLYTSQYYQKTLTKHSQLAEHDRELAIYTNYVDRIYTLQLHGSLIERMSYSLKADIGSIVIQLDHTECMYYQFKEGPQYEVYYLDMRDSAVIWSELIFSADRYNDIEMVINRPDKLKLEEQVILDFNPGSKSIKKVLTVQSNFLFAESSRYEESIAATTGLVTIEMRPKRLGIGCHTPSKMVSHLEVGCPPKRHIRVHKPAECEDYGSFTINKKSYFLQTGEPPDNNKVVDYDKQAYGCPITQTNQDIFKPDIDLYDEDELVETMTAAFVMWEDNGRHDLGFTATMKSAGCLRVAQTWEKMKENATDEVIPQRIWGPHNYESCFTFEVTEKELLWNSYQILNKSGDNSIRWPDSGDDQLYLFTLHVVDPNYSYCHLEAKIAVIISDVILVQVTQTPMLKISLGTFAGLTASVLFVTYFWYRRAHIQDLAQDLHHNYGQKTTKVDAEGDNKDD